jgi:hypothetical protein
MTDPAAAVRAEAARAAGAMAAPPSSDALLGAVEKLLTDSDPPSGARRCCRRDAGEGVGQAHVGDRTLVVDEQPQVIAAALERAWMPQHAQLVAQKLSFASGGLRVEAARALARTKSSAPRAGAAPLLAGDVPERAAATHALARWGMPLSSTRS